jgi:hypothetical protein
MRLKGDFEAASARYLSCNMSGSVGPGEIALTVMLGIGIEDPVVVLLGALRQWLDEDVGAVSHDDVQGPDRPFRLVE